MPLDSSTPLTVTGVIATILSVIFAMASYMNSQKRQRAKVAKAAAVAASKPSGAPKHTNIVIPSEPPLPFLPAPEPAHYEAAYHEPAPAPALVERAAPPPAAPQPSGPPAAAVFKQLTARPGIPTTATRKKSGADVVGNENDYVWE